MLTPSLVMVGAPHFFSSTTLRPLGPRVTLTASARTFMPRSSPRRASSSKAMILAIRVVPPTRIEGEDRVVPATDGPDAVGSRRRGTRPSPHRSGFVTLTRRVLTPLLALSGGECKRQDPWRTGGRGRQRPAASGVVPDAVATSVPAGGGVAVVPAGVPPRAQPRSRRAAASTARPRTKATVTPRAAPRRGLSAIQ